jgi:hypothetical protein
MDAQEKKQLIKSLRQLRDAHDALLENGPATPDNFLERLVDLSVRTVAALDSAIVTLST